MMAGIDKFTGKGDRWSYWLVLAYVAAQCWGIPIWVSPDISWALWPLPADLIWLAILPVAIYVVSRGRHGARIRRTLTIATIFVAYATLSFVLAKWRFGLPNTQNAYFAYSLFRLFQFVTVWFVAASVRFGERRQQRMIQVLAFSSLIVSVAALMEQFGILDYRLLVSHIPSDIGIAGPWTPRTMILPDAALGTLNYNRIYVGHYLATVVILVLMNARFSMYTIATVVITGAALWATQSRTAMIVLMVGCAYAFVVASRFRKLLLVAGAIGALAMLFIILNVYSLHEAIAITTRGDTIDESLAGRLELQSAALGVFLEDSLTPLFGIGMNNLGYFWLGGGFSPGHGQYATTVTEMGIVGLLIFLVFIFSIFRGIQSRGQFAVAVKAVLCGNIASAVFNDLLLPSPAFGHYLGLLFLLAGLGAASAEFEFSANRARFRKNHADPVC